MFEINLCRPGEAVRLLPEPKNPADPLAIMVVSERGVQMGYIAAERAPWIGRMLADALDLNPIFQERTEWGAMIRVSLDDNFPDLPPARDSAQPDPDYWPDEIPPDDWTG